MMPNIAIFHGSQIEFIDTRSTESKEIQNFSTHNKFMGYPLDSRIPGYRQAYDIPNGGNLKVRSESWSPTYSVGTTNPGPREPTTQRLYRGCNRCLALRADTDQFSYHLGAFRTLRIFGNILFASYPATAHQALLTRYDALTSHFPLPYDLRDTL